jgi:predicted lipid-binding transport protein (Tim44 family)
MARLILRHFLIAAAVLMLGTATAEARAGGGFSFGSRGGRTFTAPAPTPTAPRPAAPIQRSMTQPGQIAPPVAAPSAFGGFGRGLMMGLIGGGLIGLLSGGGMGSIFSLLLQIGLLFLVVRLVMGFFARRAALAGNAPGLARSGLGFMGARSGLGFMGAGPAAPVGGSGAYAQRAAPIAISPADYADFERLLAEIQTAFGREDLPALHRAATPEMASYFEEQLAGNAAKGVQDKVSGAKLLQGDLAEAWREGEADYATVAMRYSILDMMVERASGRVLSGDPAKPEEVTEVWTFRRPRAGGWQLSAVQQA